jgi:hypothetical protein
MTKSKIEGENREDLQDLPVINLNDYAVSSAIQEFAEEFIRDKDNKNIQQPVKGENNSPIKIDDIDLNDILNDLQEHREEQEVLIVKEYKEPAQQIQCNLTNYDKKNPTAKISVESNNDDIFNILQRESFMNNIISFMNQEESKDSKISVKTSVPLGKNNFYLLLVNSDMKENIQTIQTVQTIQTIQTVQTIQTIQNVQTNSNKNSEITNQLQQRQLFKPIENENVNNLPNPCTAPINQTGIKQPYENNGYFNRNWENSSLKRKFNSVGFTPGKGEFYNSEPSFKK